MVEPRVLRRPVPSRPRPEYFEPCPSCGHLVRAEQPCETCDPEWPADAEDSVWLPALLALLLMVAVIIAFVWL